MAKRVLALNTPANFDDFFISSVANYYTNFAEYKYRKQNIQYVEIKYITKIK